MRTLALVSLFFFSCGGITGSGKQATKTPIVEPFRKVSVASGIDLTAAPGDRAVSIQTADNIIGLVETAVIGDTLTIRLRPETWIMDDTRVIATVANDALEGVDASGGCDVHLAATPIDALTVSASGGSKVDVTAVSSTTFSAHASGGSRITLSGTASSGSAEASGGSALHLREVCLELLSLSASGGSTVDARVAATLTGGASGGSTVTILGNPSNQVATSGGATVSLVQR